MLVGHFTHKPPELMPRIGPLNRRFRRPPGPPGGFYIVSDAASSQKLGDILQGSLTRTILSKASRHVVGQ
jgi:hypothetical protein